MNVTPKDRCDACGSALRTGLAPWHRICRGCGLESSTLRPEIGQEDAARLIDEEEREKALAPIRHRNFDTLLEWLDAMFASRGDSVASAPKLLDVGCAHGWFSVKAARSFRTLGIEPDRNIAALAIRNGANVRSGYFPQALEQGERFDAIVFNDVLEHIPDVVAVLRHCRERLTQGGVVVVNAPDRRGLFYRLSKLLAILGQAAPFERMWQLGMPSPHLYYFDRASVVRAANAAGLILRSEHRLQAITLKGLHSRIRFDRRVSAVRAMILYAGTLALWPLIRAFPSDIQVWFLEADAD